jgi:hypothetical protein
MADLFVITVLFGFLGIGIALQLIFRGLPGVLATIIFGWLFLPPGRGINLPGLPMYTKEYAVSYAALLGVVCLDAARITSFRPKLLDLPAIIWILSPIPSSVTNGLGYYDGFASAYSQFFIFGVPYFLGRIYIRTPDDVRTVAKWIVIAGVIAVPLVIWESRMSPNLNRTLWVRCCEVPHGETTRRIPTDALYATRARSRIMDGNERGRCTLDADRQPRFDQGIRTKINSDHAHHPYRNRAV